MATQTRYPQTIGTGWTNYQNLGADDGAYAYLAYPQSTPTYTFMSNFGFSIPPGATINSVRIEAEYRVSTNASTPRFNLRPLQGGGLRGTELAYTGEPLTDTIISTGGGTRTAAELNDNTTSGPRVGICGYRQGSNTAVTGYLDFVRMVVNYTTSDVTGTATFEVSDDASAAGNKSTSAGLTASGTASATGATAKATSGSIIASGASALSVSGPSEIESLDKTASITFSATQGASAGGAKAATAAATASGIGATESTEAKGALGAITVTAGNAVTPASTKAASADIEITSTSSAAILGGYVPENKTADITFSSSAGAEAGGAKGIAVSFDFAGLSATENAAVKSTGYAVSASGTDAHSTAGQKSTLGEIGIITTALFAFAGGYFYDFSRRAALSATVSRVGATSESRNGFVGSISRNTTTKDWGAANGSLDLRRRHSSD